MGRVEAMKLTVQHPSKRMETWHSANLTTINLSLNGLSWSPTSASTGQLITIRCGITTRMRAGLQKSPL